MNDLSLYPRWMRELIRYLPIKTQFYISGNIYDQILYPIKRNESIQWCYLNIRDFFYQFFIERNYQIIGFFDLVDGMEFKDNEMYQNFQKIIKGKEITPQQDQQKNISSQQNEAKTKQCSVNLDDGLDRIRKGVANTLTPIVFIIDYSSRLTSSPTQLYDKERIHFLKILKCAQDAAVVTIDDETFNNITILLCDRINDIPPWLCLNNPLTKPLLIDKPNEEERKKFITFALTRDDFPKFYESLNLAEEESKVIIEKFVDLTDGLGNYELESLRVLSEREQIGIRNIKNIIERYKFGIVESAWDKVSKDKLKNAEEILGKRVKGQNEAINSVVDIIKRAKTGLAGVQHSSKSSKPRGVLFFAGPTGVGKTELAKALAELLFGDENACIRFDMSEYAQEQADQKLLGAPPGYVGYEEGGQLTNKVKEKPFSVLLFDEIEKAHPSILDKFLQILEDGRMTDGKGETVYFSESIIIFTSNIGAYTITPDGRRVANINPEMTYSELKDKIMKAIEEHFKLRLGRPEIYNRFGNNFVVFDYIRPEIMMKIRDRILNRITDEVKEKHKIAIIFADEVKNYIYEKSKNNIEQGGRGIGNIIEKVIVNPLSRTLFDEEEMVKNKSSLVVKEIITEVSNSTEIYKLKVE